MEEIAELCEAIRDCDRLFVTSILKKNPGFINSNIDDEGRTPLTLALECTLMSCTDQGRGVHDLIQLMHILIDGGAMLGLHDRRGVFPIHAIVISEAKEEDKILLIDKLFKWWMEQDPPRVSLFNQVTMRQGDTALHLAVRNNNKTVANCLMGYFMRENIDPNSTNYEGKTPAHIAAENNNDEMTSIFIRILVATERLDSEDNKGETAPGIYAKNNPDIT